MAKLMEGSNNLLSKKQALFEETMNERAALERKIKRYVAMRMNGEITREEFVNNLHSLNAQLAHLEGFLRKLESEMDLEAYKNRLREDQVKEGRLLAKDWSIMAFERKRSIIEAITKLVSISETSVNIEFSINLHSLLRGKDVRYSDGHISTCLLFDQEFRKPTPLTYPKNPETIGEQLRKKRMDSGLTQAKLAKILDVSTDCVTYWENNRSKPQISYYPRIHHFLGFNTTTFDETNIWGRLQTYRWRNGVSRRDIARLLKVDTSTVRAWEKGLNMPSQKRIDQIEALLKQ